MKKVGETWCVVVTESEGQYTALFADRDSAATWIENHMTETFAECGDDEENEKFLAMNVAQRLEHTADMFGVGYEIVLRDVLSRDTALTLLAESTDD